MRRLQKAKIVASLGPPVSRRESISGIVRSGGGVGRYLQRERVSLEYAMAHGSDLLEGRASQLEKSSRHRGVSRELGSESIR